MNKIIGIILTFSFSIALFFIAGCGGGSSGTGADGSIGLRGTVSTNDNKPVANARVTVVGTQDSAVTDATGRYELKSTLVDSNVIAVLVQIGEIANTLQIGEIPADKDTVRAHFIFDQIQGIISLGDLTFLNELNQVGQNLNDGANEIQDGVGAAQGGAQDAADAASSAGNAAQNAGNAAQNAGDSAADAANGIANDLNNSLGKGLN